MMMMLRSSLTHQSAIYPNPNLATLQGVSSLAQPSILYYKLPARDSSAVIGFQGKAQLLSIQIQPQLHKGLFMPCVTVHTVRTNPSLVSSTHLIQIALHSSMFSFKLPMFNLI